MKKPLRFHLKRGDTIVEVMLAFAIMSSLLVLATTGALSAWRTSRSAGERDQATYIAQYQANALRAYKNSMPYSSFISSITSYVGATGPPSNGSDGNCAKALQGLAPFQMGQGSTSGTTFWKTISSSTATPVQLSLPPSSQQALGVQNGISSTYSVGIEAFFGGAAGDYSVLRFDICVMWTNSVRQDVTHQDYVNQVVYLSDSNSLSLNQNVKQFLSWQPMKQRVE